MGVDLPSGAPFRCKHRLKHRNRAPGQQGLKVGANLLGRNLDGNQIAREYRTCAGHADLLFRDGGKRQAGKRDCLLEFTSRPELALGAARESGHNSICQNCLKVLLRATVGTVQSRAFPGNNRDETSTSRCFDCTVSKTRTGPGLAKPPRGKSRQGFRWCRVARADRDSQVSALGVGLPSGGLSGASTG